MVYCGEEIVQGLHNEIFNLRLVIGITIVLFLALMCWVGHLKDKIAVMLFEKQQIKDAEPVCDTDDVRNTPFAVLHNVGDEQLAKSLAESVVIYSDSVVIDIRPMIEKLKSTAQDS